MGIEVKKEEPKAPEFDKEEKDYLENLIFAVTGKRGSNYRANTDERYGFVGCVLADVAGWTVRIAPSTKQFPGLAIETDDSSWIVNSPAEFEAMTKK
jgi:hypothetical protein